jgi:predicted ribosome quality control (RQC) complex YloA/Tae2 family protein
VALSSTSSDASSSSQIFLNHTDSYISWEQEESEHDDEDDDEETGDNNDDGNALLMQEYELWTNAVSKTAKALKKKQASLQSEWEKAQNIEQTVARAQLLVSNLYMFSCSPNVREATVQDWENDGKETLLKLDPQYDSASAEADALFQKARKLKRGSKVIQELLEETEQAMETLTDAQLDLSSACNDGSVVVDEGRFRLVQDRLQRTAKLTKFQLPCESSSSSQQRKQQQQQQRSSSSPYDNIRKLTSPGGCPVLVGRNRRGNEYLSFQVARGKDIWMHARGCPGAHVLIQWRRGSPEPTDACWQFAANLATFYSDARMERKAEVTAAEAKHLLKPRGAPLGAVKLRHELQVLVGRPEHVNESLKLAREESGQSDEYRSMDKAKHRRHTQQVAKQTLSTKRAEQQAKRKRRNKSL